MVIYLTYKSGTKILIQNTSNLLIFVILRVYAWNVQLIEPKIVPRKQLSDKFASKAAILNSYHIVILGNIA